MLLSSNALLVLSYNICIYEWIKTEMIKNNYFHIFFFILIVYYKNINQYNHYQWYNSKHYNYLFIMLLKYWVFYFRKWIKYYQIDTKKDMIYQAISVPNILK